MMDIAIFSVVSITAMNLAQVWLRRLDKGAVFPLISWLLLIFFMFLGVFLAQFSEARQRASMKSMLEGFAPTYAHEFERSGHARIQLDTPADDPSYLSLIQMEKDWLRINPAVNDIYTFRQKPDGTVVLLVDSETDYDHDGVYQGDREVRTAIGEVYPEAGEMLKTAFSGKATFDEIPYTDRWGTWVSAYVPLKDEAGHVEGVLGVDYAAKNWVKTIISARLAMFGYVMILILMLIAGSLVTELTRIKNRAFERTASIIKEMPAIICGVDLGGRTTFMNPAGENALGYKTAELAGKNYWTTFYPADEYKQVEKLFKALKNGAVHDYEMTLTTKSKARRVISWNFLDRFNENGERIELIGLGNDITERRFGEEERKKLEAELQQSQKMETMGTLAGGIAHDLNNQLTPLTGYLDLAIKDTSPSDPRHGLLIEAEQASRRCAEVVQRLMNISRPSNQKKVWMKMDTLLAEIRQLFPKILPSTIRTEMICGIPIWPVLGNDTELQTVLMNMVVNARDAMPDGGKLTIQACNMPMDERKTHPGFKSGNYVFISVSDTGKGIPPEALHKVFEPFFTTKPKGQGTGLGLAMAFRVIKDHGGWIEAQSEAGKGTLMQIYLPADPSAKIESRSSAGVGQAMPGGSETILFADDEEALRNLGRMFLERLGYKVILAEDGAQAVELYKVHHGEVSAVVLDMTMPKLTGRQVLKNILEIDPKAKVLLASGFTAEGTAKELIREGAIDFLAKPYTIFPFSQMLRKVIEK